MNSDLLSPDLLMVCPADDLPIGKSKRITLNHTAVAIFHIEEGFFAIEDACAHQGASLAFGNIDGFCVACPRHGALFDIRTGDVISLPALRGVRSYHVEVQDGQIVLAKTPVSSNLPELLRLQ